MSSCGRRDFMSHSLSKTKGHLPQGVQLDIPRCWKAVTAMTTILYSIDNLNMNKNTPDYLCQLPSQWWVTKNLAGTRTPPSHMPPAERCTWYVVYNTVMITIIKIDNLSKTKTCTWCWRVTGEGTKMSKRAWTNSIPPWQVLSNNPCFDPIGQD